MKSKGRTTRGLAGFGALLLAAGGALALQPHGTHAAVGINHTGPLMTLSNGRQIQVLTSIADTQQNVGEIDYTIHGPAGTTMTRVSYQKSWANLLNRAVYVADQAAGIYTTDAVVKSMASTAAAVKTQSSVSYGTTKHTVNASGLEGVHVSASVTG